MTTNQDNTSQTTVNQDSPVPRDSLQVYTTDQPATHLTNQPFNGENYSGWSRQVRLALAAKQKLGFINGLCKKPSDSVLQEQWLRSDSMVFCWLLNSLVPDISSTLLYSNSSKELWDEIKERYGQSNGPLIFQLKREISNTCQNNDSIPMYYSKVKRAWDEYKAIEETPTCTCGVMTNCTCNALKKVHDLELRNQLLQFLMGLNTDFDQARGHILGTEPLPPINKAYQMLLQDERQRQVAGMVQSHRESEAYAANRHDSKRIKTNSFCEHCKMKGHNIEQCFKIVGYPDWFKDNRKGKGKGKKFAAHANNDGEFYEEYEDPLHHEEKGTQLDPTLVNAVCQEVLKALQKRTPSSSNYAHTHKPGGSSNHAYDDFSGPCY